ncbi:MAG TPA: DUF2911 domain-containing protein [Thermoanaerobaculia bacterium]|nr:DUF2911 domain-containing protein [Thermoanaerobaculia bacterium]
MKNRTLAAMTAIAALAVALPLAAERGDDSKRKSKNGRLEATIDGVETVVEYGRPKVQGRTIWGGLVPYGQVWRTGADEATTVSFAAPVLVEGEELPAGTYALFTIPNEDAWTVIFHRQAKQWGAYKYDAAQDALRVEVTPEPAEATEELTFAAEDAGLVLRWAELAVPIGVRAKA